jgi:hypothetical protein
LFGKRILSGAAPTGQYVMSQASPQESKAGGREAKPPEGNQSRGGRKAKSPGRDSKPASEQNPFEFMLQFNLLRPLRRVSFSKIRALAGRRSCRGRRWAGLELGGEAVQFREQSFSGRGVVDGFPRSGLPIAVDAVEHLEKSPERDALMTPAEAQPGEDALPASRGRAGLPAASITSMSAFPFLASSEKTEYRA